MGCLRSYCRECASEHDGQYLCASCLREATAKAPKPKSLGGPAIQIFALAIALVALWCMFMLFGTAILKITAPSHDYVPVAQEDWE